MIDLHIHGAFGYNFHKSSVEEILVMIKKLNEIGVEKVMATLTPIPPEKMKTALKNIEKAMEKNNAIMGVYIEGPFINPHKSGSIPAKYLELWSIERFKAIVDEFSQAIKIVTVAPERKEAYEIQEFLKTRGIKVAIGHSMAKFEEAMKFIERGTDLATHIFNAMGGFHHREPGIVGAALVSNIPCEIIAEKHHLHPEVIKLVYKIKGKESVIPVSDATPLARWDKKETYFGGRKIKNINGGCFTEEGKLYGSAITLPEGIKYFIELGIYKDLKEAREYLKNIIERLVLL